MTNSTPGQDPRQRQYELQAVAQGHRDILMQLIAGLDYAGALPLPCAAMMLRHRAGFSPAPAAKYIMDFVEEMELMYGPGNARKWTPEVIDGGKTQSQDGARHGE